MSFTFNLLMFIYIYIYYIIIYKCISRKSQILQCSITALTPLPLKTCSSSTKSRHTENDVCAATGAVWSLSMSVPSTRYHLRRMIKHAIEKSQACRALNIIKLYLSEWKKMTCFEENLRQMLYVHCMSTVQNTTSARCWACASPLQPS